MMQNALQPFLLEQAPYVLEIFPHAENTRHILVKKNDTLIITHIVLANTHVLSHLTVCDYAKAIVTVLLVGTKNEAISYQLTCEHKGKNPQTEIHIKAIGNAECQIQATATMLAKKTMGAVGNLKIETIFLGSKGHCVIKPELDVQTCHAHLSHGASCEVIDEKKLLYLTSKGLPFDAARKLLLKGHIASCIDPIVVLPQNHRQKLIKHLLQKC